MPQLRHNPTSIPPDTQCGWTVVLDTNVFVAAGFNPRSVSAKIVDAVRQGQIRMVWNDATRREIEYIMHKIPPLRAQAIADLFRPADRFTAATDPERFTSVPDPDDRKFAALAHAAGAILISNDEHLLRYRDHMDLTVLTPGAFWTASPARTRPRERSDMRGLPRIIPALLGAALLALPITIAGQSSAPHLFVFNMGSDDVTIIDPATSTGARVHGTVPLRFTEQQPTEPGGDGGGC